MFGDADRPYARSPAAVWDAKRFVQVQMANVGAIIPRTAKTDLGIHVRAVHVNLPAVSMNDVANFANAWLEHAVCRWVSHHERGQIAGVFIRFCAKVRKINISIL